MIIIKEKLLKEGPGAGYTISVNNYEVQSIDDIKIDSIELGDKKYNDTIVIKGTCIGKVLANGVVANSYYYGTEAMDNVPAEFTWFEYSFDDYIDRITENNKVLQRMYNDNQEDYDSINDERLIYTSLTDAFDYMTVEDISINKLRNLLIYDINSSSSDIIYGGGYLHSTYDGQLTKEDTTSFSDADLICDLYITDNEIINYIDKAVIGDTQYTTYDISIDGDMIGDSYNTDDYTLDDVIRIVDEKYYDKPVTIYKTYWQEYAEGDTDILETEIVWEG